jgi:hypothetical protein
MLKTNAEGTFVYLKRDYKADPKKFAQEQADAKYRLGNSEHQLEFDGEVDKVVLGRLAKPAREAAVKDIKELAGVLDDVAAARPKMDAGEKVRIEFGQHGTWEGRREVAEFKGKRAEAYDYVFTPVEPRRYQTVIFTDNGYVRLKTDAFGIRHEVTGRGYRNEESGGKRKDDSVFYISEMVGVSSAKGKGKPEPPASKPPATKPAPDDRPDKDVPF